MRFGQTLFGGAVAGLVIVTGAAICDAQASGHNEVTRLGEATGRAYAHGSADVRRVANNKPVTLSCAAVAAGNASVDYRPLPVEVLANAVASGRATVDFYTYAFGNAYAQMTGHPVRRVKLFPLQARAYAFGEADVQTWQLGYAKPAVATAKGFGTTYYVGDGPALASAYGSATAAMQAGGAGRGLANSAGEATCLYTAGFAGTAYGSATWLIDSAVTRAGVLERDGGSTAVALASAVIQTAVITQSQTGYGRSTIVAYPKCQIGAKGQGRATATGFGDGVGMATGAAAVAGNTAATASAKAFYQANAKGQGTAKATGTGSALAEQTRVVAKPGTAKATASANGLRTRLVSSAVVARATTKAAARRTQSIAQVMVRATATAKVSRIQLLLKGGPAQATAVVVGKGYLKVTAQGLVAQATAQAIGSNQINDLAWAPLSRTCVVEPEVRLTLTDAEPRQILI